MSFCYIFIVCFIALLKRIFDIIFSSLSLILLFPLFLLISLLVLAKLGMPIFYKQPRPGKCGKIFYILKFRTMLNTSDPLTGKPLPDSLRITPFGKWLRSSSLDELPELINVFKGDMSIVGPRPLLVEYLPLYSRFQSRRHDVLPGITGWAQVNGRNTISWDAKFKLDVWYVDNRSFLLDIWIIIVTLFSVLQRSGIDDGIGVGQERFKGNN